MANKRKRRILFLFIVPALVFYLVFWISPVLMSFFYGLTNWSGLGDYDFVGLDNFKFLIKEGTLFNSMRNTIIYAVIVVVWGNLQALALALLLNMKLKARGAFRTIFYIPALFSTIVVAFIWSYVYAPYYGMLYEVLGKVGIGENLNLLGSTSTALIAVAFVETWKTSGTMTIIYLAGLQNIPEELYEAAKVDGANAVQRFFKITLPYMLYVTTPYLIVTFTGNVNNFNIIYLLSGGDPVTDLASTAGKTDLLVTWLYKLTIDKQYYNIGAVIGILTFIILAVGALLTYRNSKSYKEGGI